MYSIFQWLGYLFGYVLWFCFDLFNNYGIAIFVFTVLLRLAMFPLSVKQQKSMAMNARMASKQQALREKYANDKEKLNEEIQKLYEREGISPTSGCLTSFVPMFFILGIFYSVTYPLRDTLHIAADKVDSAIRFVNSLPGMGIGVGSVSRYEQISFVKNYSILKANFPQVIDSLGFDKADLSKIEQFSKGFKLFGLDLLETPSDYGVLSVFFLIPLLCFVTSVLSSFITMKLSNSAQTQQGCMKLMFLGLPLFSAYIAYVVPAAVGFYWICSTVISFFMTLILNKFYNAGLMTAKQEAQHVALLEQQEANAGK